ncbi:hypothetical protein Acsp07_38480 [Actinomycetospora sp. NBRC 106378]|nr:hypothetical protein Acsp07_38480 [Actinomycetospora sp. NBRC 106378]
MQRHPLRPAVTVEQELLLSLPAAGGGVEFDGERSSHGLIVTAAAPGGTGDVSLLPQPFPPGGRAATLVAVHRAPPSPPPHVTPSELPRRTTAAAGSPTTGGSP